MRAPGAGGIRLCVAVVALQAGPGCVVKDTDVPVVTGPSGFAYDISASAEPSRLPRDGSSWAVVTVVVKDPQGQAAVGRRLAVSVAPTAAALSTADIVTDARGMARVQVTAPPAGTTANEIAIQIAALDPDLTGPPPRVLIVPITGPSNRTRPTPEFVVSPAEPEIRQAVVFDASATRDEGASCDGVCGFTWTFGDGATAAGAVVVHQFTTARSHEVTLRVADDASATATVTRIVVVRAVPAPTVAVSASPASPIAGQRLSLTAVASPAAGHSVVRYEWDFGDGTGRTGPEAAVFKTYPKPGRYTATVLAIDDLGQRGSAATAVVIGDAFTFPDPAFTISPAGPVFGPVSFVASGVFAANGVEIVQYQWEFGDGSPVVVSAVAATTYIFQTAGTYIVRLTVTDALGRTSTRTREVTVK